LEKKRKKVKEEEKEEKKEGILTFVHKTAYDGGVVRITGTGNSVMVGYAVVKVQHVLRWIRERCLSGTS